MEYHEISPEENGKSAMKVKRIQKIMIIAAITCLLFFSFELIGGIISHSIAIITDATHILSDLTSFLIGIFSIYISSRPATDDLSYGFFRAEIIGGLISINLLWVITGILIYEAILRIINPHTKIINATIMLIVACIGVLMNTILGLFLYFGGIHDGFINHSNNHKNEEVNENINIRSAMLHVLGDLLQSIAVVIGSLIIFFKPSWSIVDPLLTFFFSFIVIIGSIKITRDIKGTPPGIKPEEVYHSLLQIDLVVDVHDLHIWFLSFGRPYTMSCHLVTECLNIFQENQVLNHAKEFLKNIYHIEHCTIQLETKISEKEYKCLYEM